MTPVPTELAAHASRLETLDRVRRRLEGLLGACDVVDLDRSGAVAGYRPTASAGGCCGT